MGREMQITMAEEAARHWGERLAVWLESLSPKAQELILRVLAAMPGGEALRDYGVVDEDATIGAVEGMILANYMRAALSAGAHVHEEVLRRHFLGEDYPRRGGKDPLRRIRGTAEQAGQEEK